MALNDKVTSIKQNVASLKTVMEGIQEQNAKTGLTQAQLKKISDASGGGTPFLDFNTLASTLIDLGDAFDLVKENLSSIDDKITSIEEELAQPVPPVFSAVEAMPAEATSAGTPGQFYVAGTDFFLCVATDTWVKLTLQAF